MSGARGWYSTAENPAASSLDAVAAAWLPSLCAADAARGEDWAFEQFGNAVLTGLATGFLRIET